MSQCNTTRTFIVVRHGSNGANQPMTPRMVLGTVQASDEASAKEAASARHTCYANQRFEVLDVESEEVDTDDANAAFEADALESAYGN